MSLPLSQLEYTTEEDEFFDYCLWDYKPAVPFLKKFRSVNLLYHSYAVANVSQRMFDVVRDIRKALGVSRTVWGIKQAGDQIKWEFYVYDYRRRERDRSMTLLLDVLRPYVRCDLTPNENLPYFMFSIDVNDDLIAGGGSLDEIHMYIGNVGSTVSSGICYSVTQERTRLENFYFFFDATTQREEIVGKIASSAYVDTTRIAIDSILWPELRRCRVIVVANKQHNDCIYFSRINVDQLLFFLRRMNYRRELVSFIEDHRLLLDHLLFDVGFDYRMEGGGLTILKSGYYGFF
ncbi:MAG TPA: hypothetical protein VLM91_20560 [Candidatus Methylomirabilis sp.]|nr:hypothetical protein [Candidatus Methylomirabilis sp.]